MHSLIRVLRSLIFRRVRVRPPRPHRPQLLDLAIELPHPARVPDGMPPRPYPPRGRERASHAGTRQWLDACAEVAGLWQLLNETWWTRRRAQHTGAPWIIEAAEANLLRAHAAYLRARRRAFDAAPWTPTAPSPGGHPFRPGVN